MALIYKDRAKQKLEKTGDRQWELSPPEIGFRALPVYNYEIGDNEHFGCSIVCQDGKWWTGYGVVTEEFDEDGSYYQFNFARMEANSTNDNYNRLWQEDFSTNPAEVFCTLTAGQLNEISAKLASKDGINTYMEEVLVSEGDTETVTPDFSSVAIGYGGCPVYGVFEISVVALNTGSGMDRIYKGEITVDGTDNYDGTLASIAGNTTDATATLSVAGNGGVSIDCSVEEGAETYSFSVQVIAKNLVSPACG